MRQIDKKEVIKMCRYNIFSMLVESILYIVRIYIS